MGNVTLGRTGLVVSKDGFGALPIQRIDTNLAVTLLRQAFDKGINFFDTARLYSDSEEKVGNAFAKIRHQIIIATKTPAKTVTDFWTDLETSLKKLKTDYIDIYQFHNPSFYPQPGDSSGLYDAMLEAKAQGKIRFIGITNHRLAVARDSIQSNLYDTLQFPFSYLANNDEQAVVKLAEKTNVGFISMKALAGGLLTDIAMARAWQKQFTNAVPIWGIQHQYEFDQLCAAMLDDNELTQAQHQRIEKDRAELGTEFCRGCGYCLPCPANIEIFTCARMSLMLRRAPATGYLSEHWQQEMAKIDNCIGCGHCKSNCPYGLDTPALLKRNHQDYKTFL